MVKDNKASSERIKRLKELSEKLSKSYDKVEADSDKFKWLLSNLSVVINKSKCDLYKKEDIVNFLEDIVCVVEDGEEDE